jgi:hypothetical protein
LSLQYRNYIAVSQLYRSNIFYRNVQYTKRYQLCRSETITASFTVTNTGKRDGEDVPQL